MLGSYEDVFNVRGVQTTKTTGVVMNLRQYLFRFGAGLLLLSGWATSATYAYASPLDDAGNGFAFTTGAFGLVEADDSDRRLNLAAVLIDEGDSVSDPAEGTAGFLIVAEGSVIVTDDGDVVSVVREGEAMFIDDNAELEFAAPDAFTTIVRVAVTEDNDWDGNVIEVGSVEIPGPADDNDTLQIISVQFGLITSGTTATLGGEDGQVALLLPLLGSVEVNGDVTEQGNLMADPSPEGDEFDITAPGGTAYLAAIVLGSLVDEDGNLSDAPVRSGEDRDEPEPTTPPIDNSTDQPGTDTPDPGTDDPGENPDEDPGDDPGDDGNTDEEPEPNELDSDSDGISDDGERDLYGTDPNNPDSDGDGLTDGQEVFSQFFPTDPNNPDTDGDGLGDNQEVNNPAGPLNPLDPDCDKDGLLDGAEVELGTGPCVPDTDGDGLTDLQEVSGVPPFPNTDPFNPDTDGDGFSDGVEVNAGTSPVTDTAHP
jgi:hypothetical protein